MQDAPRAAARRAAHRASTRPARRGSRRSWGELRGEGRALLVATHDVEQARRFDRVLCLHRRQIAFGPPAEIAVPEVLQATYGAELVVLDGGRAAAVGHHHAH